MREYPTSFNVLRRFPTKQILIKGIAVVAVLLSKFCILKKKMCNFPSRIILMLDVELVVGYLVITLLHLSDTSNHSVAAFTVKMSIVLQE
jgi:hypothetical protein